MYHHMQQAKRPLSHSSMAVAAIVFAATALIGNTFFINSAAAQNAGDQGASTATDAAPDSSHFVPATTRATAAAEAKMNAGRENPFSSVSPSRSFPSHGVLPAALDDSGSTNKPQPKQKESNLKAGLLPPPPPGMVPGPPPLSANAFRAGQTSDDLTLSELPAPPSKPSIADKLQLTGIIGERAIFKINDPQLRQRNKWPAQIIVGKGDQFETVAVDSISPDTVTLEEDGEKTTKELPRIR